MRRVASGLPFRGQLLAVFGLLFSVALIALPAKALAGEPTPFGHACKAENGVRFCPTETLAQRVPSWDGVPLDVDVTLPASGSGPWPTIVMLHGWGTNKTEYENNGDSWYFAQQGYAVVTPSARGWARSCGTEESRVGTPACADGYTHMDDTRYESRDDQYLLGLLADEGIANPKEIGAMGGSYGGGQSIELAYLKNRIRLPNGQFERWKSPDGKRMRIKAAFAIAPFSDLVDALQPNGRFLDTEVAPLGQSYEPPGVQLESVSDALNEEGPYLGAYYAPEGTNPEADLYKWGKEGAEGEPWTAEDEATYRQIYDYHQAYGMPLSSKPAPMLIMSGWTDEVFPVEQALRVYNQVHAMNGYVALMFGDVGHAVASNKENTALAFAREGARFFAAELKHEGKAPQKGGVTAYTQTCPLSAPAGGPFSAKEWSELSTHTLTFGSSAEQTFTSAGASPLLAYEFDPIVELEKEGGNGNDCKETKSELEPNSATYTMTSPGFTLLGLPTISAHVVTTGDYGQIDARLWDVLASGEERLISRGVYRLTENQTGAITFQLHGNGYQFANGDTVKLELLGRDAPYYRASNTAFTVEVSNVSVVMPTS
ncbi:MAG: alpha/beta fold hydrolase [Solirubrobacteraceae bacterium]